MPIEINAPAFQQAWLLEAGAFNSQELSTAAGLLHLGGPSRSIRSARSLRAER